MKNSLYIVILFCGWLLLLLLARYASVQFVYLWPLFLLSLAVHRSLLSVLVLGIGSDVFLLQTPGVSSLFVTLPHLLVTVPKLSQWIHSTSIGILLASILVLSVKDDFFTWPWFFIHVLCAMVCFVVLSKGRQQRFFDIG